MGNQAMLNEYMSLCDRYNEVAVFEVHLAAQSAYPSEHEGINETRDKLLEAINAHIEALGNAVMKMNNEILELMNK